MVGLLVICVVFRDAPVQFFTGYRRGDIRISNFIKYRIILDTATDTGYLLIKRLINIYAYLLDGMHIKIGKVLILTWSVN